MVACCELQQCVTLHQAVNVVKNSARCETTIYPARGRVGRVIDCGVRGLRFKSPGSILTSRTETSSLSPVGRGGWDPCSVPESG